MWPFKDSRWKGATEAALQMDTSKSKVNDNNDCLDKISIQTEILVVHSKLRSPYALPHLIHWHFAIYVIPSFRVTAVGSLSAAPP